MHQRVKCLLVDDREDNLLVLTALLRADDVEILLAASGSEALELLLVHEVALAFLDVQMPEMDGFELAELMRGSERTRHVPIIFVTAGGHDQHRSFKGYESGAVDFLYKPIEPHVVQSKADVFFQLHRQKQQLARELIDRTETLRLNELFIAVLGHDLRNPLNAIFGYAQALQMKSSDVEIQDAAARILSSSRRMGRMIEDLVDLARARLAGGIPIRSSRADLRPLIERVVHEHRASFPDHSIDARFEGELIGDWDGDRLAQVASNLLGNALRHGAPGHTVSLSVDGTHDGAVVLSVANTGTIAPELVPHLFEPFRGGERRHGRSEGLGLGLYIVQQIVRAYSGTVQVITEPPNRTEFRVTLPRQRVAAAMFSAVSSATDAKS